MLLASEREEFELALKFKEILFSIEKIKQKRITSLNKFLDADVISYQSNEIYSAISVLIVRKGMMLGSKNFSFSVALSFSDAVSQFILSYYTSDKDLPDEIVIDEVLEGEIALIEFLKEKHQKTVSFINAKQGVRRQLLDMATVNAIEHLEVETNKIRHKTDMTTTACKRLKELLKLKNYPRRIECFDISNISGTNKVGSMAVFIDGEKSSSDYRRFSITSFLGADDFKSHQEVMKRRLTGLKTDPEKFAKPDLIVIDGGKGQLSAIIEVFNEFNVTDIDLIALAERDEEIFVTFQKEPIVLDKKDYSLHLLQRIRDEAHRFAITYHKNLRSKQALSSVLDGIKGIGKVKRLALLEKFKDIDGIRKATKDELKSVNGIGEIEANEIILKLTEEGVR